MALPFVKEHVRQTRERAERNLISSLEDVRVAAARALDSLKSRSSTLDRVPYLTNLPFSIGEAIRHAAILQACNEVQEVAEADEAQVVQAGPGVFVMPGVESAFADAKKRRKS